MACNLSQQHQRKAEGTKRVSITNFITIEGGEGVGKSVFIHRLEQTLKQTDQRPNLITREPGGTQLAEQIRALVLSQIPSEAWTIEAEFCMMSAARAQHFHHRILPHLQQGHRVICDRFADSSRVYQGIIGGLDLDFIHQVTQNICHQKEPDITLILDCDPEISVARTRERCHQQNRYDERSFQFHSQVRAGYLKIQQLFPHRCYLLDASVAPQEIVEQALPYIIAAANN